MYDRTGKKSLSWTDYTLWKSLSMTLQSFK